MQAYSYDVRRNVAVVAGERIPLKLLFESGWRCPWEFWLTRRRREKRHRPRRS